MRLILTNEGTLDHSRTGGGLPKGDLGDDVRIADNCAASGANLLPVILDDMRGRTAGIRAG